MSAPEFISDDEIKKLLNWDTLVPALEKAMGDLSRKKVIQPPRLFMRLPPKNAALLAMPAFNESENALGCKLVTSFPNNEKKGLPSVLGTILFMDSETGKVKVILEGTEITTWRTAGTSVVATKNLHQGEKKVLAVLGAGVQGRIHALAMMHFFNFDEVRIWNRTPQRAKKLCEELGPWAIHYTSNEECVKGADVIVTATYSPTPVVMKDWVKDGALINAIGTESNHHGEVDEKLYKSKSTSLFADHMDAVVGDLNDLVADGVKVVAEIGQVINKSVAIPVGTKVTIFQSLGMAIEDVTTAKLIYESYTKKKVLHQNKTSILMQNQ